MALKPRWMVFAQVAASIALLVLAVVIARPAQLRQEVTGANAFLLAASLLAVPLLILLRTSRWRLIARTRRAEMTFRESLHSYLGGLTLAVITPWAAGELARGAFAAPEDKASFVGLTFLDKLIDITMLFLYACAGLFVVAPGGLKVVAAVAAILVLVGWAAMAPIAAMLERLLPRSRLADAVGRALSASGQVPRKVLATAFLLAALNATVYYGQLYVIMYAFSPTIRPGAAGLFPLITLSRVIPSIAGLGVREFVAAAIFAKAQYEVTSAAAVAAAFAQYIVANVLPAAVWLVSTGGFRRFARHHGESGNGSG